MHTLVQVRILPRAGKKDQTSVSYLYNLLSNSPKQTSPCMRLYANSRLRRSISLIHKYLVLIFQRVALFSAFATSAMCNAGFDVVDVYPLSDAYPDGAYDYAHYKPRVFWDLETLLEKYKTQNNEKLDDNKWKNALKRCIG